MDQTTQTFLRLEAIFHEALAAPVGARAELIAARCHGDGALEAEVESLLKACAEEELTTTVRPSDAGSGISASAESKRIGPYLLDRLLGRGGMGAVYLAHRVDGHFEQNVAIKLIDLPLATDLFRERFRQERQILAGLQHPYIARLLDGGVTPQGDLYLAMEYVDGVPIHRYCEDQHLSIPDRLALFLHVCEAVQFAHQNLVVHRDLKPDNIFVASDRTPRLLDFGTAKLLSPSLANPGSEFTREGYQSFTPQYASPEQVLGNPITTASDTYSLGVLLYLLLTATLPYELKELTLSEMLRVICEEAPRRPGPAADSAKRLDPDLEAILQKALRKEPKERYLTAEQLAADIRAYLAGQPVAAQRGSFRYRASKYIRRHRLALTGVAVVALTLIAGIAGVLWQAKRANDERRRAEARSSDLRQLSSSLLSELDEAIKQLPGSTGVQKLLVTRVLEHLDRMATDAQGDRLTQLDLVDAYTRLGNIQGNGYEQDLGDPDGALVSLGKAIVISQSLVNANPDDRQALQALATAQECRSEVMFGNGANNAENAIVSMQAAAHTYDKLIAMPNATAAQVFEAATTYGTLGDELGQNGMVGLADIDAALATYRKAIELDNRVLSLDPTFMRARRGIALNQMKIGNVELETNPGQALQEIQASLQKFDALPEADRKSLVTVRLRTITVRKEALAFEGLGNHAQAIPLFDQALQIHRQISAADPKDLRALTDVDRVLDDASTSYEEAADPVLNPSAIDRRHNLVVAKQLLQQSAEALEQMLKQEPSNKFWQGMLANAQVRIGAIQYTLHDPGASETLSRHALETLRDLVKKNPTSAEIYDMALSAILEAEPPALRDPKLAVAWAERGVALSHGKTPAWFLSLARAYRANAQPANAAAAAKQGLALLPALPPGSAKPKIRKLLEFEAQAVSQKVAQP